MEIFEWNEEKNKTNFKKHGVSFETAKLAFKDSKRVIYEDIYHSTKSEKRYFCLGKVGNRIYTVRFTWRNDNIRIFGVGVWRKERKIYEKRNKKK